MAGQGSDAGRRPTLREDAPLRSVCRGRPAAVDEVAPATLDERAVAKATPERRRAREQSRAIWAAEPRRQERRVPAIGFGTSDLGEDYRERAAAFFMSSQ
jgi:hypothetical protein